MSEQNPSMSLRSSFPDASQPLRLAQIVSRFPMVTETFVLYELEAMEKLGVTVELYSLLREYPKVVRFAYEMEEQAIQQVHGQFAYHAAVAALIVHRLTGMPFSFTARGSDVQSDGHMLKEKVEAADFVISVSEYNKEIILRKCGSGAAEKIHVITCGVYVVLLSTHN